MFIGLQTITVRPVRTGRLQADMYHSTLCPTVRTARNWEIVQSYNIPPLTGLGKSFDLTAASEVIQTSHLRSQRSV